MKTQIPDFKPIRTLALLAAGLTLAHAVPVRIPALADVGVTENYDGVSATPDGAGDPVGAILNVRFGTDRNEVIALRFDLSGYDRQDILAASVRLINYRANSNHTLKLYGVSDGATGFNATVVPPGDGNGTGTDDNWPETGTTFSTTPGLEYDANSATGGFRLDRATDLGSAAMVNVAEGTEVTVSTTALKDFLLAHEDDVVTILVACTTNNTGQKQFASREATTLLAGTNPQPAGTYAPSLYIDLPGVRIPASNDTEMREQDGYPNSGTPRGGSAELNVRWIPNVTAPTGNNEIVALQFNLTGYNPLDILSAEVRLINYRDNTSTVTLRFHGVVDGSTGMNLFDPLNPVAGTTTDDDWLESTNIFKTTPGLDYDGNTSTTGVNPTRTVDLGTVATATGLGNTSQGTKVVFSNAALVSFLKNHPDNTVTILITDTSSGAEGQKRFASKDATGLNGATGQPAGTFAPEINLLMANIDRDDDGLRNDFEELYGLDPDLPDSDGDSIPDGEEDPDSDSSNNLAEQTRGTVANNPDTDTDGLLDGYETLTGSWGGVENTGTNPLVADTDGDSLPDGLEDHSLPYVGPEQPGTDPNLRDTDSDLYSDGAEISRGTDPTIGSLVPDGAVLELLGTGTGSLLPGPLTDPENDIIDTTPAGANFNWVSVTSTSKPFFGTGVQTVDPQNVSGAYDLFDNKVGVLNDKWLAGNVGSAGGASTTVEFPGTVSLSSFTITSADDRPERDPAEWQILGSNDGTVFTPIFTQLDPARLTVWSARNQVVRCTLAAATPAYRYLRFACTKVGASENQVHVNEIQYFGTLTADAPPPEFRITSFTGAPGPGTISLTWLSQPGDTYRITYSTSLTDGFAGIAAGGINASGGSTTSHSFANPLPAEPRLFFRVEKP